VKCFGNGLLWQELFSIPGNCNRGDPSPDTDAVAVAEGSAVHLDVRSFGVVSQGVTLTAAAGGRSSNLPGAYILGGASALRTLERVEQWSSEAGDWRQHVIAVQHSRLWLVHAQDGEKRSCGSEEQFASYSVQGGAWCR
jgi:hypothetical protein